MLLPFFPAEHPEETYDSSEVADRYPLICNQTHRPIGHSSGRCVQPLLGGCKWGFE